MSRLTNISLSVLSTVLLLVLGCSDASSDQEKKSSDQENKSERKQLGSVSIVSPINPKIKSTDGIALVNGVVIRRSDYDRWVLLRARIFCAEKGLDLGKRNEKLDGYIWNTREQALLDLIRRELIRQACEKRPIVVSNTVLVATQKRFMKFIRRPKDTFDTYVMKLPGDEGEELRKQIYCDARDEVFLKSWATNDIEHVSVTEVSNRIAFVQNYNRSVDERNAASKKRAAAAKAEILAGASFYSVTTNRADIFFDQARFWDVVELGDFEPSEDIFKFLTTAKAGDISDPLDFDDGIGLVGVLQKEDEPQEEGKVSEYYTLVRCMFNGYDPIEESDDFESVRESLLETKVTDARQALVTELFNAAKIEYPFGNKLFARKKIKKARMDKSLKKVKDPKKRKPKRIQPPGSPPAKGK